MKIHTEKRWRILGIAAHGWLSFHLPCYVTFQGGPAAFLWIKRILGTETIPMVSINIFLQICLQFFGLYFLPQLIFLWLFPSSTLLKANKLHLYKAYNSKFWVIFTHKTNTKITIQIIIFPSSSKYCICPIYNPLLLSFWLNRVDLLFIDINSLSFLKMKLYKMCSLVSAFSYHIF